MKTMLQLNHQTTSGCTSDHLPPYSKKISVNIKLISKPYINTYTVPIAEAGYPRLSAMDKSTLQKMFKSMDIILLKSSITLKEKFNYQLFII